MSIGSVLAQEPIIEYTLEDSVIVTDERSTDLPAYNLTATKLPVALLKTPASVSVVKRELLDEAYSLVVGDALNFVSGVNPQTQNGVADFFYIRGFSSLENGLVLVDGTPEPEVSFYNLYNVDRVEVIKGPSTFLYGGNPLAGAVNLVHKKPIFRNFGTAGATFGQFNSLRGTVDAGFVNNSGRISGRINGMYQQSDGYRDDKENSAFAVNPVLTFVLDTRSFVNVDFEYLQSEYTPDSGIPLAFDLDFQTFQITGVSLPDVDVETNFEEEADNSEQDIIRGKIDYNRKLNSNLVLRNKFYYSSLDWESAGTLLNGSFFNPQAMASFVDRSFSTLDDKQVWLGNQLELLWTLETGIIRHKLLVGAELSRLTDVFTLEFTGGTAVQLDNTSVEVPSQQTGFRQFFQNVDASAVTIAPYILDRIELHPKAELLLGGRLDVLTYEDERSQQFFDLQGVPFVVDFETERDYTKFNPMAGLVVLPTPELSLYANYSAAFAPPST
ncbi:MAG: TonB-dependent receptor, partial [Calditrichota bacterium]